MTTPSAWKTRLIEECRARAKKRHKRIRSKAGKQVWKNFSKRKKHERIKQLWFIHPSHKRKPPT